MALAGDHLHRVVGDKEVESGHVRRTVSVLRQTRMVHWSYCLDCVPHRPREWLSSDILRLPMTELDWVSLVWNSRS